MKTHRFMLTWAVVGPHGVDSLMNSVIEVDAELVSYEDIHYSAHDIEAEYYEHTAVEGTAILLNCIELERDGQEFKEGKNIKL